MLFLVESVRFDMTNQVWARHDFAARGGGAVSKPQSAYTGVRKITSASVLSLIYTHDACQHDPIDTVPAEIDIVNARSALRARELQKCLFHHNPTQI